MSSPVKLKTLPKCNFCQQPAHYDFKTANGQWAFGCDLHYDQYRAFPSLGVGKGSELVKAEDNSR